MTNGERFEFNDECPVHETEIKSEYDFGIQDSTVYTFKGCRCAVCHDSERGWMNGQTYWDSYEGAEGAARLIVAVNSSR